MTQVLVLFLLMSAAQPDTAEIVEAFTAARAACRDDNGRLWGEPLCGPLLVADFQTGTLIADRPTEGAEFTERDGVYIATLPEGHLRANTAVEWAGLRWTQVMAPLPRDEQERLRLFAHESFHRVAPSLGLQGREGGGAHLDTEPGRYWQRLEWRALARALRAKGPERTDAAADARVFRRHRLAAFPGVADEEEALWRNEGLAEYTGIAVAYPVGADERAADGLDQADGWASLSRQYAYATGPAWGRVLDDLLPGWRAQVLAGATLDALVDEAIVEMAVEPLEIRSARYGGVALQEEERRIAEAKAAERRSFESALMGDDALVLPLAEMQMSFDYRDLVPLPPHGTVYRTLTVSDRWGRIEISDGLALISSGFDRLRVPAPATEAADRGPGWTLHLAPDWKVEGRRVVHR